MVRWIGELANGPQAVLTPRYVPRARDPARRIGRLLAVAMLTLGHSTWAGAVRQLTIVEPMGYWEERGFAGMVPSIHLPTTHSRQNLIHVWLKVPPDKRIDAGWSAETASWQLLLPAGTQADRAEYHRVAGSAPGDATLYLDSSKVDKSMWTLADVRGTRVGRDGRQSFHVYRPMNGTVHAPLRGWSWPRGEPSARQAATNELLAFCRQARRPIGRPPMDAAGLAAMRRLNDCAACHQPDRPPALHRPNGRRLERGTDNLGFYVPTAVLSDDCVVAHHRPEDVNDEDPFVEVRCGEEPAQLVEVDGEQRYQCPNERVPVGHRDVAAGLAAGHEYTQRVCASRRWLFERMTPRARTAYAEPLAACGLGRSQPR